MPIYEYACLKCGRQHEAIQKISDKPLTRCPSCKGKLTRLISASAFQLKGTGWYATDYPKKGAGGEKKDGEGTEAEKKGGEGKEAERKGGEKSPEKPEKKDSGDKAAAATAKE